MKTDNVIQDKSYQFALRIVKLHRYLTEENKEYVLSRQVLRSGTSVGANVEEAIGGQTEKDFFAKLSIAYKEARETSYWIRLLRDSEYLKASLAESILADCDELIRIIGSIQKTIRARNNK
ncbi:MAG: four helix bundle protein [Ferruginibacter sp.]|nr:four helix bundle protein [Cytophagales bacterium]